MNTPGCRRCLSTLSQRTRSEAEVRRIARLLARGATRWQAKYLAQLDDAKANLAARREDYDRHRAEEECDSLLSTEHWTKRERVSAGTDVERQRS